jgi:Protein of unknown function (DUF1353)
MRKRCRVSSLLLSASLFVSTSNCLAQDTSAFPKGALYAVIGVAQRDQLNIRIDPRPNAWVISRVPPHAKDVMSTGRMETTGNQRWLLVHHAGITGWVNTRFLRSQPPLPRRLRNTFFGDLMLQPLQDGRNMRVVTNVGYIDDRMRKWEVPAGSITDGASIPRPLWSIIGSPFTGKYLRASVLHDRFVATKFRSWADTHEMFYNVMIADGVGRSEATLIWAAVYRFGPRWTQGEATCWNGCIGAPVLWVDVRIDPEFVDKDLDELKQFIADNPAIEREKLISVINAQLSGAPATLSGRVIDFNDDDVPAGDGNINVSNYDDALKYAKTVTTKAPLEWPSLGTTDRPHNRFPDLLSTR